MTLKELEVAYIHSSHHRHEIQSSDMVGCFHCQSLYVPAQITEWIDCGSTALCAKCGIDSVIGSDSGLLDNFAEFLAAMHAYWF